MAAAFQRAVELMFGCGGRVVVTGMGKSGLIARKIAATLSSTGTPALYLHPVDALHGDLGMVVRGDVVLALSASGETEEILALLATIKRLRVPLIAMTGRSDLCGRKKVGRGRPLHTIDSGCGGRCGPGLFGGRGGLFAGTGAYGFDNHNAGLGDALAVTLSEKRGFKEEDFANLHPGGKLGKRLARVVSLMHSGEPCLVWDRDKNAGRDL
jgi:arabinose-5-phosphate isomerase